MKACRKAQVSLEYGMMYGWALILIATIISVLVFVTDENLDVTRCPNFLNIICKGIGAEDDTLSLVLQNATGQKITLNPLTSFSFDGQTKPVTILYGDKEYTFQDATVWQAEEFTIRAEGQVNTKQISITFVEGRTGLQKTLTSSMKVVTMEN